MGIRSTKSISNRGKSEYSGKMGKKIMQCAGEALQRGTALLNRVPGLIQPNTFMVPLLWNNTALQIIRETQPAMPITARALAILHTCMYTAWAAYDPIAVNTSTSETLRQPPYEWTLPNKEEAISYAAYYALRDLFPTQADRFKAVMISIGYNPTQLTTRTNTPASIGKLAAKTILSTRHWDGSNQLGDLYSQPYSDYTHYDTINDPDHIHNPNRWQPLRISTTHGSSVQQFTVPHWGLVQPFAMMHGAQFRPGKPQFDTIRDSKHIMQFLHMSTNLTEQQKVSIEYWRNGPQGEQAPGHWCLIAQYIARRDAYNLDTTIKLFFILTNALLDASIACWDCKRAYDTARPLSYIRSFFHEQPKPKPLHACIGPQQGIQLTAGQNWHPYQPTDIMTPASPEYCSAHSTFSAASAAILSWFTGSDYFGGSYTQHADTALIEPGTNITLNWKTFSSAADDAGMSQLHSGVHFAHSYTAGKTLGHNVAAQAWRKAQNAINGKHQSSKTRS